MPRSGYWTLNAGVTQEWGFWPMTPRGLKPDEVGGDTSVDWSKRESRPKNRSSQEHEKEAVEEPA
jgi:hypothetical protein